MSTLGFAGLSVFLVTLGSGNAATGAEPASPAVDVQIVKYSTLTSAIRQWKGKVIVVDCWADY